MAITSAAHALEHIVSQKILHRPLLPAAILSLVIIVWFGLIAWQVLPDRPLASEKISAHRLRVNSGQLNKLTAAIASYQSPAPLVIIPTDLFGLAPKITSQSQ